MFTTPPQRGLDYGTAIEPLYTPFSRADPNGTGNYNTAKVVYELSSLSRSWNRHF